MARRRPRLFSFSREVELGHFAEVISDPEDRQVVEDVVDAFIDIGREHQVTPSRLAAIARGARHPLPQIRGMAITRLSVLAHYFDEAATVLGELCTDRDEEVRLFACSALANTPAEVAVPWLDRALTDRAWRVRKAAAQAAGAVVWPGLLEVLEEHGALEGDARVGVVLSLAIAFQRGHREAV